MPAPSVPLAAIRQPAMLFDVDGRIVAANGAADVLAGRSLVGLTPDDAVRIFHHRRPDGTPLGPADLPSARAMSGGNSDTVEVPLVITAADGRILEIIATASPVMKEGAVMGVLVVWRDVTAQRRVEAALRESEARFRSILDRSLDALYRRDLATGRADYYSPAIEAITGFSVEESMAMSVDEIAARVHPDDLATVRTDKVDLAPGAAGGSVEYRFLRRDGTYCWVSDRFRVVRDGDGRPLFREGVLRDITERKQAEDETRSVALFPEENPFPVLRVDDEGRLLYVNVAGREGLGDWRLEAGDTLPPALARDVQTACRERMLRQVEMQVGPTVYSIAVVPVRDGRYVNLYFTDVTGRKRLEEELAATAREAQLRASELDAAVLAMPSGVIIYDASAAVVRMNEAAERMLGLSQDVLGRENADRKRMPYHMTTADGTPLAPEEVPACRALRGETVNGEEVIYTGIGEEPLRAVASASPIRDGEGRIAGAVAVFTDVTAHRETAERLRESEDLYRALVEASAQVLYRMNPDWSEMRELSGGGFLADTEEPNRDWLDEYIHVDDQPRVLAAIGDAIRTGSVFDLEHRVVCADGTIGWTASRAVPVRDTSGQVVEWFGAASDITDRTRAEASLREREQALQGIFRASPVGIGICSHHRLVSVNDGFCRMTGYGAEELDGQSTRMLYPDDETYDAVVRDKYALILANGVGVVETRWRTKDGARLDVLLSSSPMDPSAPYENIVTVALDLTSLREKEAALRESEERFRTSFELTPLGVALGNLDGTVLESNTVLEEMLGHSKDALRGMSFSEFTHPDDLALERPLVEQALAGGTDGSEIEKRYIRSNGGIIWVRVITAVLRDGIGAPRSALAIIEEITDRRRAEEMLKESEAKYRNLVELSPDAILIHQDGAIVFANPAAAALVGVGNPDELIGRPILDLVRADARYLVAANIELDLRGKDTPLTTLEVLRDDGAIIPVQGRGASIPFDGRPAVQVVLRDVSAEMRSAEALQRSEAEYRHLVEHAPTGIYEIDYAGPRFRRVNDAMCRILGYTREELMAMNPEDLLDEESRERLRERLRRIAAGEDVDASVAFRIVKRDGQAIWAALTVRPTRAADGRMDGALVVAHDITERMRNEEALREARDYLNSLIDYANAPIIVWDPAFRITRFNAAFENLSGYAADEVLGRDLAILFPEESREETLEKIRRTLTEQWESVEIPILRPDGGVRIALWNSATIFDREGTAPLATIAQGQDITDRKRAEAALREYAENLQRSNEDLERFAYVASHDLQEPLRSIVSFSQLLERRYRGQLGQDADEYIEFIVEGGNRMQTLILDLLAYSRVNTTAHELRPTDVEAVIAAVERHLDGQLRKAGAALTYDPLPTVLADPLQLEQIFVNLVTNAVKFHRQGEPLRIHVGARRLNGFWEFSVADNGIGIEPEYYDRIFVIFQRLHTKDAYPGTGIGLAIVKRIVERHGGTVRVDSTPGEGSTFFFTLPAA